MHFLFEIIEQKNIMQKGSYGARVTLVNLVSSVTPFSLHRQLTEKGILCRKVGDTPSPAYVKLMNYVQLTSAD